MATREQATAMTRPRPEMPLYPSEAEVGRAVLGSRAKEWPALAVILERKGLPQINSAMGGRYWPKVEKFFQKHEDLDLAASDEVPSAGRRVRVMDFAPDGQDNANGAQAKAFHRRRPGDRDRRAGA